ncbi:transcription repressor OFP1-like [Bidens hawaiensis]|uniref:transcription repressor OFP1-like n=1 Tax=Bidens hawaiensis TaxID=980011 RepID=UPI00404973EC
MGNYRFRLSDMIPSAWFHKLKDTSNTITTNHHKKPPSSSHHSSSTTAPPPPPPEKHHFHHPNNSIHKVSHNTPTKPSHNTPTKPSQRSTLPNRKTIYKPSPKHTESTHSPSSESTQSRPFSYPCPDFELQFPPIITKPANPTSRNQKSSVSGTKQLRAKSKRIAQQSDQTKNFSESVVVVKSSYDPEKDFMLSMMEMITENNIRSDKDLEELLGWYLSLNSDEYHDVIVKAFEQIWFSLPGL